MRAFTRYAAPFAALVGLTIGLAPAAGASTVRPAFDGRTHTHIGPAATTVNLTCEEAVSTTGLAVETITRDGPRTVVRFRDSELGDGYTFVATGAETFYGHHRWYRLHAEGFWFNNLDPAASFHRDMWVKVFAHHEDEPTGFESDIEGPDC